MLKFAAGAMCGWVAARSLSGEQDVPPSTAEVAMLAQKLADYVGQISEKMKEQQSGGRPNQK
jgi:hypothetical protein|tara:strand:+ start:448 stop:633 length:186 start_codon:yes stop_codon:yes gene_type:complete